MAQLTLDWDTCFSAGDTPANTSFGSLHISFSTSNATGDAPATQSTAMRSTKLGTSTEGHLLLTIDADQPGRGIIQTIEFEQTGFPLNQGVGNLTFELLDVDRFFWEDQVEIIAYDPDGVQIDPSDITLTADPGAGAQVTSDSAQGQIESDDDEATGNVTVLVAGNVARVDIIYTAGPYFTSGGIAQKVGIGPLSFDQTALFDDSGGAVTGSLAFTEIESIICFTPGTRIVTDRGEVPVEVLRPRQLVLTQDNGFTMASKSCAGPVKGPYRRAILCGPLRCARSVFQADRPVRRAWQRAGAGQLWRGAADAARIRGGCLFALTPDL